MVRQQPDYKTVLDDVRHIYKQKYGVNVDDELLYLVIRVNELQVAMNKKFEEIPKVTFPNAKDYFVYSLGKYLAFLILGAGLLIVGAALVFSRDNSNRTYEVVGDTQGTSIKLHGFNANGDTTLYINNEVLKTPKKKTR